MNAKETQSWKRAKFKRYRVVICVYSAAGSSSKFFVHSAICSNSVNMENAAAKIVNEVFKIKFS